MIELNSPTLNASSIPFPIATSLQAPVESTNSSSSTALDFSAILTEMIGPGPALTLPLSSVPALALAAADSKNSVAPGTPGIGAQQPQCSGAQHSQCSGAQHSQCPGAQHSQSPDVPQPQSPGAPQRRFPGALQLEPTGAAVVQLLPSNQVANDLSALDAQNAPKPDAGQPVQGQEKPKERQKTQDLQNQPDPTLFVPVAAVLVAHPVLSEQKPIVTHDVQTQQPQVNANPGAASIVASTQPALPPEIQRAWADVKKFEFTVQNEAARGDGARVQPQVAPGDVQKQAIVTTDPIANIQLQQLPPRITAIEKLAPETKLPDRTKPETPRESADTTTPGSSVHFADASRAVDIVEQARPAHHVEIPQIPHAQVVRTVAMEVGDADSQVTVRIQERAGDISLQINAANEPLHQDLQSSVGSLVQALKQEQVQVSNVDVSRKSPIDKVRRMKEAN